jgi:ABC-2 type transport system ATP-binding protein
MTAKLDVLELRKRYGKVHALQGVDVRVNAGEIVGLLGPNGAGKTTTVECIAGLVEPDSGSIEVCGIDARRDRNQTKQRMGFALASTALPARITPREAITSIGAFYERAAPAEELLTRFDLQTKADSWFETLSTGQRQRLALALAVVNRPELLILDEPSAGLDPEARSNMRGLIAQLKSEGAAVLLTTHDMNEAETLCDRVAVIHLGRVVAQGAPADLIERRRSSTRVLARLERPISAELLAGMESVTDIECEGGTARFAAADLNRALAQFVALMQAHGVAILELHAQKATLEEVVASLV